MELLERFNKQSDLESRMNSFIKDLTVSRETWTEKQVVQNVVDLFMPENKLTLSDTYDKTLAGIDISEEHGAYLKPREQDEARMYSLEQIHALWHLQYSKSHVRKRLDKNDSETADVRTRMQEMEQWRDQFEKRFADYQTQISAKLQSDDVRFDSMSRAAAAEFDEARNYFDKADRRDNINRTLFDEQRETNENIQLQFTEFEAIMQDQREADKAQSNEGLSKITHHLEVQES